MKFFRFQTAPAVQIFPPLMYQLPTRSADWSPRLPTIPTWTNASELGFAISRPAMRLMGH
jgi:hypothetical protein